MHSSSPFPIMMKKGEWEASGGGGEWVGGEWGEWEQNNESLEHQSSSEPSNICLVSKA